MPQGDDQQKTFGTRPWPPDGALPQGPNGTGRADVLAYDGWSKSLAGIVLRNTLFGLLTLGVYRFWGKTRLRRYLWSHLRLLGDRLEYTGTAKELFLGFLVAIGFLVPLSVVYGFVDFFIASSRPMLQIGLQIFWYLLFGFLIGIAIYRAQRYRMTRTLWRGIRFGLTGSSVQYALRFLGYSILFILTLGLSRPLGDVRLHAFAMNNSWFGSGPFRFHGKAGDLFGRWALCWLLIPFTLGLSLIWYSALWTRYSVEHTRFQKLGFAMPVTFGDLARIILPYYLVVIGLFILAGIVVAAFSGLDFSTKPDTDFGSRFNLKGSGIAAIIAVFLLLPALQIVMVTHRMMKLVAARLVIEGNEDLDAIVQNAQTAPKTGEGLADALDVGGGVEVGF